MSCMCACLRVCVCSCVSAHGCVLMCVFVCACSCVHVCSCVCMLVYACACSCVCMLVHEWGWRGEESRGHEWPPVWPPGSRDASTDGQRRMWPAPELFRDEVGLERGPAGVPHALLFPWDPEPLAGSPLGDPHTGGTRTPGPSSFPRDGRWGAALTEGTGLWLGELKPLPQAMVTPRTPSSRPPGAHGH